MVGEQKLHIAQISVEKTRILNLRLHDSAVLGTSTTQHDCLANPQTKIPDYPLSQ